MPRRVDSEATLARHARVAATRRSVGGVGARLADDAVDPRTADDYKKEVERFLDWLDLFGQTFSNVSECDYLVEDYMEHLWDSGQPKYRADRLVYGLEHYRPEWAKSLFRSHRALRGWNRRHKHKSYPPMPWEVAVVVAMQMARTYGDVALGIAVLLGHDCLLRIGELLSLKTDSIADAGAVGVGPTLAGMGIWLKHTKTGPNQSVTVEREAVARLLRWLCSRVPRGQFLFPYTVYQFRRRFKAVCADLSLTSTFVPHSLRHGGATRLFIDGESVERIMLRGRWASTPSARRYIQATCALAIQGSHAVPAAVATLGRLAAADVIRALAFAATM
jgi:integrase